MAKQKKSKPIYVSSKNDPKLKAYNDSLSLYNSSKTYSIDAKKPITAYSKKDHSYLKEKYPNSKIGLSDKTTVTDYTKSTIEGKGYKSNLKVGKTYDTKAFELEKNKSESYSNKTSPNHAFTKNKGNLIVNPDNNVAIRGTKIAPIGTAYGDMKDKDNWNSGRVDVYKKPTQPVIYKNKAKSENTLVRDSKIPLAPTQFPD